MYTKTRAKARFLYTHFVTKLALKSTTLAVPPHLSAHLYAEARVNARERSGIGPTRASSGIVSAFSRTLSRTGAKAAPVKGRRTSQVRFSATGARFTP
ncbi:hypothetical protein U746_2860 [Mycolicibacterium mucogenicum 261Sha1.1M5]|nr:hypothetical protein U746_2860 [Mycolicibacterium mucogenicum 261Sha1.1M5]